jgi:chromate transporter
MIVYLLLFYEFFKIGLFAVGGGPATLPYLMDLTEKYDWFTMSDLSNMVAVSQSTPGPLGLNMATYAGYQTAGVWGGVVATMALVFPSVIIIVLIAKFMADFSEKRVVKAAFYGIRPAVTALIAVAVIGLFEMALITGNTSDFPFAIKPAILCVVVFGLTQVKQLKKLHPAWWLLSAAVIGVIFKF